MTALVVASGKVDAVEWTLRTETSPGTLSETFEVLRPISPNLEGFGAGKIWVASETSWECGKRGRRGRREASVQWGNIPFHGGCQRTAFHTTWLSTSGIN